MYSIAVVIQNSNESKLVYGADVSGRVFKEISDRIYNHYLSTASLNMPAKADTSLYTYQGKLNDVRSILNYLNMTPLDSARSGYWRTMELKNNSTVLREPVPIANSATPNVIGMGLKDAIDLLENKGFKTAVSGRGKVINQSIVAGTIYRKGEKISLVLN